MSSIFLLAPLLERAGQTLAELAGQDPVLDVGCGDGEVSFFFESLGFTVDAIDYPEFNFNSMQGVRLLKEWLRSSVGIHAIDLDTQFTLPRAHYGLALLLGVLYHMKNPIYVLEALARCSRYCFLTTRIARRTPDKSVNLQCLPVAYLVEENELNRDCTNYWIFSETGLGRLLRRSGWEIVAYSSVGNTRDSDPATQEGDERAVCLVRSTVLDPIRRAKSASGWHDLEQRSWRWTERVFSAMLGVPRTAKTCRLDLHFVLPEAVLTNLGPITLTASVNGRSLGAETYALAGPHTFLRSVPPDALTSDTARVEFELDRALASSEHDHRELGIVVRSLDLNAE